MDRFTGYDLEEATFYLYKSDLYIKLDVMDIVENETGITIELGEDKCYLVIWNDSKITEVLHPANVIGNFSWCLEIKDKDNKLIKIPYYSEMNVRYF